LIGAAEKIAGNGIPEALSTQVRPSVVNVDIDEVLAAAALAGVIKPPTVHATFLSVVTASASKVIVRDGLL
jgi:hypothetical protein